MYTGPKTINNGLVYGYDTAYGVTQGQLGTRFYPGEPTVNRVTDTPDNQGGWVGSHTLLDSATKKMKLSITNFNGSAGSGQGWRSFTWNLNAFSGQTVAMCATIEIPDNSPGDFSWVMMGQTVESAGNYLGYSAASERYYKTTKTTEKIYWTGTLGTAGTAGQPSGHVGFTVWYNDATSGTASFIHVSNVQIELKSHKTPFVNGTRSNTQGLIDLKNTASIDLSYISFDSTAQPTFDGTNDYILTPFTRGTLGDQLTMIAYYKFDGSTSRTYTPIFGGKEGSSGTEFFIGKNSGNTNIGVQDGNYSSSFVTGSNAWDGNYHQLVYTYENGNGKIYLDGVLKSSGSFTKCNAAEQITVGSEVEGSGYYMIGDVPRVCVFDRVLTADEVLEDFNANKNRFNI